MVFSRVSNVCVAALLGMACVCTASAQESGARIRLLEEKLIEASPAGVPAVSYSVRDIGRVAGAARLALPETGGHALVLTETGKVWAWGDNRRGQLGVGDTTDHPDWVPVAELDSVVAIAAGAGHGVALRQDGSVWTWGANEYGQSGDGSLWARNLPERVPGLRDVVAVAAGAWYTLALRRDGTVWAWGSNWTGVAPGVAERTLLAPVKVQGLPNIAAIWVKGDRPYARDAEGRQWTWGTPEADPRQVEPPVEPETSWPGLTGRDRVVRVAAGALEVEENREVVVRVELGGALADLQAGGAVGWIEVTLRGSAGYALASEATVDSGQRTAEGPLAVTASTTTLGSAPNPAVFGTTVTLTASVSSSVATGRVTFYDGATVLGVGTLASGTATLQSRLVPAGNRSLRAYYWGDANYQASTSGWVSQTVNAQPAGSFLGAVDYGAGTSPSSVAIGDFNGDGRADLAAANYGSNNVSVLLGNSNGTFQAAVNSAVGGGPIAVTVGDFNGDGKTDLAAANLNVGNVGVLLGNGNGTFQAAVNYTTASGAQSVAVGDFNGDGKPDLVVANWSSNTVSVLLGNGNGTFQARVNYAAGSGPSTATVGDFNGDGKADLAVANAASNNVSVLLGNGDGTFQAAVNYATGDIPDSVAVADFNGDGKADLAVANYFGNNVSVLLANGNGTFQAAVNYGASTGPYSVAVGDLNGDAKADLAVANYDSNNVSVLLGNGDGTFQAVVNYGVGASKPSSVAVGDFNGDGKADLAVAKSESNKVSVLLGTGGPPASPTISLVASPNPATPGQLVTLTATVTPSAATGQVTFLDGTTVLGVGALVNGTATFTTSLATVGSRSLRAYYGGDGIYGVSTSGWVTQVTSSSTPGMHYVGSMAQIASGNYWKTTITLVNHGTAAARARLNFFDNGGGALLLAITYSSLPPADPVLVSTVERSLEPGASFSFATTGPDDVGTVGWAQMLADGDISGFAVFRQRVQREQEAVVPLETHNSNSYVLWFNNSGDFSTGLAVANSSASAASIPVIVRDEAGNQIGTETLELPAMGHISGALTDIIGNTGGKVGSVEFRTPPGGQISVLGLRFNGISFTTIPVLDRPVQTATAPLSSLIPAGSGAQLASGHYWGTTITLVNKGNFPARTKLDFFDNQGNPLVLPLSFPTTPGVPGVELSSLERTLAPGASLSVSSTGPVESEKIGWARLSSDGDVGGFAIFRQNVDGAQEALVPMEIGNPGAWLQWFDNNGTFASGVAVVNNATTRASIVVIVRDEAGAQIHTQTLDLAGLGHISGALTDIVGNTAGRVGSVEFRTPPGGAITVLGLRFNGVSFTTIPVMPIYR
jgi:hypothetical protein